MGLASLVVASSLRLGRLEIYGPMGLHKFICEILSSSETSTKLDIVVNELVYTEEDEKRLWSFTGIGKHHNARKSLWKRRNYYNQHPMSDAQRQFPTVQRKFIHCSEHMEDGETVGHFWNLFKTPVVTVTAGLIQHSAPCFGFVIHETDKSGPLDPDKIASLGVPQSSLRSALKYGQTVTLPNGRVVKPSDVIDLSQNTAGRKVVILGDTSDASMLEPIAIDCDLLIHEATLLNTSQSSNIIRSRGHSTPYTVASTAHLFRARRVLLNHISPQFTFGSVSYHPLLYVHDVSPSPLQPFSCSSVL